MREASPVSEMTVAAVRSPAHLERRPRGQESAGGAAVRDAGAGSRGPQRLTPEPGSPGPWGGRPQVRYPEAENRSPSQSRT